MAIIAANIIDTKSAVITREIIKQRYIQRNRKRTLYNIKHI
jgi:hypothetical protein